MQNAQGSGILNCISIPISWSHLGYMYQLVWNPDALFAPCSSVIHLKLFISGSYEPFVYGVSSSRHFHFFPLKYDSQFSHIWTPLWKFALKERKIKCWLWTMLRIIFCLLLMSSFVVLYVASFFIRVSSSLLPELFLEIVVDTKPLVVVQINKISFSHRFLSPSSVFPLEFSFSRPQLVVVTPPICSVDKISRNLKKRNSAVSSTFIGLIVNYFSCILSSLPVVSIRTELSYNMKVTAGSINNLSIEGKDISLTSTTAIQPLLFCLHVKEYVIVMCRYLLEQGMYFFQERRACLLKTMTTSRNHSSERNNERKRRINDFLISFLIYCLKSFPISSIFPLPEISSFLVTQQQINVKSLDVSVFSSILSSDSTRSFSTFCSQLYIPFSVSFFLRCYSQYVREMDISQMVLPWLNRFELQISSLGFSCRFPPSSHYLLLRRLLDSKKSNDTQKGRRPKQLPLHAEFYLVKGIRIVAMRNDLDKKEKRKKKIRCAGRGLTESLIMEDRRRHYIRLKLHLAKEHRVTRDFSSTVSVAMRRRRIQKRKTNSKTEEGMNDFVVSFSCGSLSSFSIPC
jgi:hypothetical protein